MSELENTQAFAGQIVQLSKRVLELETKLAEVTKITLNFSKFANHATTCDQDTIKTNLAPKSC